MKNHTFPTTTTTTTATATVADFDEKLSEKNVHFGITTSESSESLVSQEQLLSSAKSMSLSAQKRQREAEQNSHRLLKAILLCFFFFLVEAFGGWYSGSLALISDACHLLSDALGFFISLLAIYIAQWSATKKFSFGFHRAEVLGVLSSVVLLYILTVLLLSEAWERIQKPEPVHGPTMIVISTIGLIVNITMAFFLGHDHAVDGAQGDVEKGRMQRTTMNMNMKAALLHALGDALYSFGVLCSSIAITLNPAWIWLDPICTFLFSFVVIGGTVGLLRDSFYVLMEATPSSIDSEEVACLLETIPGVFQSHSLHVWSLTMDKVVLSGHLSVDSDANGEFILQQARELLLEKYEIRHVTIQIDRAISESTLNDGDDHHDEDDERVKQLCSERRRCRAVSWLHH